MRLLDNSNARDHRVSGANEWCRCRKILRTLAPRPNMAWMGLNRKKQIRRRSCHSLLSPLPPVQKRQPCFAPGRRERLPAHAPLRTVRESFPSHGSSLSKNIPSGSVPLLDKVRCIFRCILTFRGNLAMFTCGRVRCAPSGDSSGTHQATGVARHLHFPV
jgi:hypothetical protein